MSLARCAVALSISCLPVARACAVAPALGDIYVNVFGGEMPLQQYHPDGTFVRSFGGPGNAWEGATIARDGMLFTTRRSPTPGISIFDADGNETMFATPEVGVPGDVSLFADGTLAVSDQDGDVDFYSRSGLHLGTVSHPSLVGSPFGNAIGFDDTLWVAVLQKGIAHFARDGSFLGEIGGISAGDLVVDSVDGSLWIPNSSQINHFSPDGTLLGSFSTSISPAIYGIALASDRTLYLTSTGSDAIYHYGRDGMFLDSFAIPALGRPLFMTVAVVPEPRGPLLAWMVACALICGGRRQR